MRHTMHVTNTVSMHYNVGDMQAMMGIMDKMMTQMRGMRERP